MWLLVVVAGLEAVALAAAVHWWRRPAEAFLGGEAGKARWRRRLLFAIATSWLGVGLVAVVAYFVLVARVRPGQESTVEEARERVFVEASPETCLAVVSDFESYPEWAEASRVEVREWDAEGRAVLVTMERASPMGQPFLMTIGYEYGEEPLSMGWWIVDVESHADLDPGMAQAMTEMSRSMSARYRFEPDGDNGTLIAFDLSMTVPSLFPSFMKGRMAALMAARTVESFRGRVRAVATEPTG